LKTTGVQPSSGIASGRPATRVAIAASAKKPGQLILASNSGSVWPVLAM
jgi:hypothetical protein